MSLENLHNLPEHAQQAILNGPALAPPPGVIPNLDDPPNQNALGLAVTTICLSISTLAVLLVAYARFRGSKKPYIEDSLVLASYGLIVGVAYCLYEDYTALGFFVHQWNVRVKDLAYPFYIVHVGSILYSVAIMLLKVAILLQWVRLFVPRGTKGTFYWASYILLGINILLYTTIVITICASCKPFAKLWDRTLPGKCSANREVIDISTPVINLVSDLIILVLPQRVIWKLKMKTQKKIGITLVFLVGIFAIVSAALRVYASLQFSRSKDKTYEVTSVAFWAIAELTCGILIYCFPTVPGLLKDSKPFFKPFTVMATWVKSPFIRFRTQSGLRPSFGSQTLSPDSLLKTSYDNSMPESGESLPKVLIKKESSYEV